jgi:hypothetical protein
MRKIPLRPGHPERICWGCEHLCPADDMRCGNGTERAQHPIELWGEDWQTVGNDTETEDPEEACTVAGAVLAGAATLR